LQLLKDFYIGFINFFPFHETFVSISRDFTL
jgi:hypothetical protein